MIMLYSDYENILQLTLNGRLSCFNGRLTIDNGEPLEKYLCSMLEGRYIEKARIRISISEGKK